MNHILLFESYKSQKELEKLIYQIFIYAAEKTNKEAKDSIFYIPNIYLSDYPELLNEYVELKEFIEKGKCFIGFTRNNIKRSEGSFSFNTYGREITLYYGDEFLDKLKEYHNKGYDLASILYYEFNNTLLHEIQHAYDHYRSGGKALLQSDKFINNKIIKTELKKTFDEGGKLSQDEIDFINKHHNQYLNLKHEVDARFTTALSKLRIFKSKYDDNFEPLFYYVTPWEEVIKNFKFEMAGWDKLTTEEKKRLVRRLYQFYEYEKDKAEKMNKEIKNHDKRKPVIFKETIYRIPTKEELLEVDSFKLNSDEIIKGLSYTIIGRGIKRDKEINMIIKSLKLLVDLFPNNKEYTKALEKYISENKKKSTF